MTGKTLGVGLDLIGRGFSIFPIQEGAKYPPLVKNWPSRASVDPDQIAAWAEKYSGCNWGIHCKGMIVLDIDVRKGGRESLEPLLEGGKLPATLASRTPSGGFHIFYMNASTRNGVNVYGPGIDVRSDNGYVVAPGGHTDQGPYAWVNETPPASAPEWMTRRKLTPTEPLTGPTGEVNGEASRALATQYLANKEIPAAGNRDNGMIPVAAQLKDFGVPFEQAVELLYDWAIDGDLDFEGFTETQFEKCIRQGYKTKNDPGSKSHEAAAEEFEDLPPEVPTRVEALDNELYTPYDVGLADVVNTNYLVKGWLDSSSLAMLFGRWGAGKTFTAIDLGAHVAAGQKWFGQRVRQGSVLYLGYEGATSMKRRLFALKEKYKSWDWESIPFYIRHMDAPLVVKRVPGVDQGKPKGAYILERLLLNIKDMDGEFPALVVIDPLRDALGGSDSDVDYTQPYIEYIKKMVRKLGCAALTVHHPGHGESERSRGDSGLEAAMDSVIRLDDNLYKISSTKQRDSIKESLYYSLDVVEVARDIDGDPVTTCVVSQVSANDMDPALTDSQRAVWTVLKDKADEEGTVKKSVLTNGAGSFVPLSKGVRDEILAALIKKQYLFEVNKTTFRIGEGPVIEEFN